MSSRPSEEVQTSTIMPLWRNPAYLLLWSGQAISEIGNQASQTAFPLLILGLTHSPIQAGIASALRSLAYLVVGLPAGALIDRWDRKRTMILCDAGRALALVQHRMHARTAVHYPPLPVAQLFFSVHLMPFAWKRRLPVGAQFFAPAIPGTIRDPHLFSERDSAFPARFQAPYRLLLPFQGKRSCCLSHDLPLWSVAYHPTLQPPCLPCGTCRLACCVRCALWLVFRCLCPLRGSERNVAALLVHRNADRR